MPRLMSVAFTEDAVRERRKTVTRRKGWWRDSRGRQIIKPGDRLTLCRKVMGRTPGEPLVRICEVEVVSVRREPLCDVIPLSDGGCMYAAAEMEREGFPGLDPREFVQRYFVEAQGMARDAEVTRIEWRYLDEESS